MMFHTSIYCIIFPLDVIKLFNLLRTDQLTSAMLNEMFTDNMFHHAK
ncbi:hypothetical protein XSR1_90094 [Xenorhabdus szentirmaii DSM 16338]|uniref:Uncharacterized protein n=1 Tax=Xenorhabdus szentirmaii DSM 16338 TaxID=1427518 RepID=W1J8C7_9GAMM|nr:hypothetical protein XSR1_90094 [Xenorhabdus szentirmaii DSM 16338]